ncbi:MAG: hypothetical protein V4638_12405 [Bacteroidota bacterium]
MAWGSFITVFLLSTFKFMFAPFTGAILKLTFLETFLICAAGGTFGAAVFYFSAEYFMKRSKAKHQLTYELAIKNNLQWIPKKKFTKFNRFIIRLKRTFGIYGISFWAPFFLSVPIGSIITAKFYGKLKKTFPLIVLGMFINSLIMTSFAHLF